MSTETGVVHGIPEAEYHSMPGLSQSGAKLLLDCPARYRHEMDNRTEARHYDVGHAVHTKVLGVGMDVASIDLASRRGKAWAEHEAAARAAGHVPMLAAEVAEVDAMAEAVLDHAEARALMERPGTSEVSLFWTEDAQAGWDTVDVPCRGRVDRLTEHDGAPLAVDLKTTTKSSAPLAWRSSVLDYGYDIQAAGYDRGHRAATGQALPMTHIVVEKRAPWIVAVYPPMPEDYLARGEARWLDAVQLYATCTTTDTWPGRPGLSTYPALPAWAR